MKKLTVENLNNLFSFLEQQPASVLWIRSKNYERQLYLSSNFEKIWSHSSEEMYKNPNKFNQILLPNDQKIANEMIQKGEEINTDSHLYRIYSSKGEIKYIKDWHYLLTDENGQPIGFAGFAQSVPQQLWEDEYKRKQLPSSTSEDMLQKYIFDILKNELHIHSHKQQISASSQEEKSLLTPNLLGKNGELITLTKRESQCLMYLLQGKSAKQTAAMINISVRTVEFHLDNIREKAKCRTKLEILGRIAKTS